MSYRRQYDVILAPNAHWVVTGAARSIAFVLQTQFSSSANVLLRSTEKKETNKAMSNFMKRH